MDIPAWVTPKAPLEPLRSTAASLGPMDVALHITHCGICHSDLHLINDDWGISWFPPVRGHEVIGEVTYLGSAATYLNVTACVKAIPMDEVNNAVRRVVADQPCYRRVRENRT